MVRAIVVTMFLLTASGAVMASDGLADPRFYDSLRRLDPMTRLDQICDYEAMLRIDRDSNPFHPDRAKAEVLSTPHRTSDTVATNGGAFRSDGHWYALSYTCKTSPDHLKVIHFSYQIGKLIPSSDWPKYGLWR